MQESAPDVDALRKIVGEVQRSFRPDGDDLQSAIIEATFLQWQRRQMFQTVARSLGARFYILDCAAPLARLRERITGRRRQTTDASEAILEVLERQMQIDDPLTDEEVTNAIEISETNIDELLQSGLAALGASRMMTQCSHEHARLTDGCR